jgi:cytochrome c-type biogenesis protein CcmH
VVNRKRTLGWLALAVVVMSALVIGVMDRDGPRTPEERARNIGETISCPVCDGQSVADSDAAPARSIRVFINEQIDAGRTDAEIRADVDRRFPESLLLTPQRSGVAAIVWVLPVVVLVLAVAGVGYAFVRWRDMPRGREATPADHALVDAALQSGDGGTGTGTTDDATTAGEGA